MLYDVFDPREREKKVEKNVKPGPVFFRPS